ncbi:hypothetical protein L3Q82_022416, partial [Scortum barcoo]
MSGRLTLANKLTVSKVHRKHKQDVLPKEAAVLQHLQQTSADVLPVCGCQCPLLHCGMLGGSISKKDTSRLDKLIRRAGSVVGTKLDSLVTVAESRTLDKLLDIMDNASHPLHTVISNQRSLFSERLLCSFPSAGPTGSRTPLSIMPSHSTTPHKGGGGHR